MYNLQSTAKLANNYGLCIKICVLFRIFAKNIVLFQENTKK